MARLPRVCPLNIPQHIIQRGNNRHTCFAKEQDFIVYISWLKDYANKFKVDIHAWVLMTNHVHLLCTPRIEYGISNMMQGLGRQYVRYFNKSYHRTGTLWEGRFKSCLIEKDLYLLHVYRYIELNPVRAKMVNSPEKYKWSSYQVNALGKKSQLCSPHELYLALASNYNDRLQEYRQLFSRVLSTGFLTEIRQSSNSCMALGSEKFKQEVELLTGRRMQAKKNGRPPLDEKDKL